MFLFLVFPCLVVAVQPFMEWIPIKKKKKRKEKKMLLSSEKHWLYQVIYFKTNQSSCANEILRLGGIQNPVKHLRWSAFYQLFLLKQAWPWVKCFACINSTQKYVIIVIFTCHLESRPLIKLWFRFPVTEVLNDSCSGKKMFWKFYK